MASDTKHFLGLQDVCDEIVLLIFSYLEIPELLSCSRTSHRLRRLALDPVLHAHRLRTASHRLSHSLGNRPPLSALRPPAAAIYLTSTHVAARKVSWSMRCIRLSRRLSRRPSPSALVRNNILPREYCTRDRWSGEMIVGGGGMAPSLIGVKRRVERERLKDGLRVWIARRAEVVKSKLALERDRPSVKSLVYRFGRKAGGGAAGSGREGKGAGEKRKKGEPARGHVLGLRRFWESMGRGQQVT